MNCSQSLYQNLSHISIATAMGLLQGWHQSSWIFSALHHASLNGNTELISLLVEAQATVDIKDNKAMRPLHYAAWQGKVEPMKMLLKAGSTVNTQSDEGQIPLHLSAQHGHYDVSEMLLQHQSNPCIVDIAGKTPLDLACEFGRVGVVQLLLSSNMCAALLEAKPGDITDPNSTSPLHLAAKNGHIDIIRLLLQAGIDINRQTKAGTALHEAALCGKTEVVRLLLESGINAHIKNTYNQTALDIVNQFTATQASREIKQMLREASAAIQVRAVKDYCNNYDLTSLNVKGGDVITVLEQHPDGRWKGCIHDNRTGNDRVGYFPSTIVEVINKRSGSRGSESSPSQPSPVQPATTTTEEIWVLRKPFAGRDHLKCIMATMRLMVAFLTLDSNLFTIPFVSFFIQSPETVFNWLSEFQLQQYAPNFINAGYDIPTISRMTPEDLTAIGVTKPGHRKKIAIEINRLNISDWLPDYQPNDLMEWLSIIGLTQYYKTLVENGYENIEFITDITWEDLQEIGITKLGHQKKFMLAVKKLAEIQKAARYDSSTLKKKAPQTLEIVAIESPQGENAELLSPKMSTFQDSELSNELQAAMTNAGDAKDNLEQKQGNHIIPAQEDTAYRSQGSGVAQESEVSASKVKTNGNSQEIPGRRNTLQSAGISKSQENLEGPTQQVGPTRRGHRQGVQRASVPPVPGKPRGSVPPAHQTVGAMSSFTPPQTPTKPRASSPQTLTVPQATAKVKPTPQLLQSDRPMSPRSLPQSPTHRGFAYVIPQPIEGEGICGAGHSASPLVQAASVMPVSVPVLCLPPHGDDSDEDPLRPKKRAHSLNRYAMSDSEQDKDELSVPDIGPYATIQRRVGRSHSVRGQSTADKNVNRSQSFALRPKKKGPPPPPPKRSSSAISTGNLTDDVSREKELRNTKEPDTKGRFKEQRRASDFGGTVDTGSAGSVKSIAAMLEMSSIGGGVRALTLHRSFKAERGLGGHYGQMMQPASFEHSRVATVLATVKHGHLDRSRDAIGLDGEIINRRRTISGPVTGLIAAARRDSSENIPFAEEGNLTIRQRPKLCGSLKSDMVEFAPSEISGTLKRRGKPKPTQQQEVLAFHLIESNTVKRRPKLREKDQVESPQETHQLTVLHNGMGTVKRRPVSDLSGGDTYPSFLTVGDIRRRNSGEHTSQSANGESKKPFKPPVSPKPLVAQSSVMKRQGPAPGSAKKSPAPSPGSPEVKRAPPPVSPKPTLPPPLTPPKPIKPHTVLQSLSASPTPVPSPAKQPAIKAASTPPSLCSSPAKPITSGQPQQVPVKPPRSSISGLSTEMPITEVAQMKLEETSASLAAALQAVEDKIKQDEDCLSFRRTASAVKSTGSILDDIGSMFDDLADQLDAMLE
uniref:CASK interacting protein 1 n=1 Tax=Callorhinchus milii TaxID=7868 RepID=A0A4W3HKW2_CALMI